MDALGIESPFFRTHEGRAGAQSRIGNRDLINFGSYDYIGLNGDARLHEAASQAMARYGISASASRLVSGERPMHAEFERALASHYNAEAALTFVSGHATNVTVIGHLMGPRDVILHDAAIHNSCVEGARLSGARRVPFAHNDLGAAERELKAARRGAQRALLVVEGHYSMDGDVPDLAGFVRAGAAARCLADGGRRAWPRRRRRHRQGRRSRPRASTRRTWTSGWARCPRRSAAAAATSPPGRSWWTGCATPRRASSIPSACRRRWPPARWRRCASCTPSPGAWRSCRRNARLFRDLSRARGFDTGSSAGLGIVPVVLGSSVRADAGLRRTS